VDTRSCLTVPLFFPVVALPRSPVLLFRGTATRIRHGTIFFPLGEVESSGEKLDGAAATAPPFANHRLEEHEELPRNTGRGLLQFIRRPPGYF